ncbi:MAG: hypothetical protein M1503_10195 [Thaumarchaeota archaeon]|nr:hypothetical protein [Nitrososphaerota archaeon]
MSLVSGRPRHVVVDRDTHRRLKILSATYGVPVELIVERALKSVLDDEAKSKELIKLLTS